MAPQERQFSDNNIMAFQTGTQVRPELGRADVSGFARAGMITGQALANLGQDIGKAITKYKVNEEKKAQKQMRYEAILPYTTGQFGAEEGEKMAKAFANDPKTASSILQFAGIQRERSIVNQAIGASTEAGTGDVNKQDFIRAYTELGGGNIPGALKLIDEVSGPGEIEISPEGIITQDGKFMGQVSREVTQGIPTKVLESEYNREQLAKARELYAQGKITEAQDITTSIGIISKIDGYPIPVAEVFEDIDVNPDPDPEPAPTPDPLGVLN